MKKVLYYHVYLSDNTDRWSSVVLEQMKCAEDSGLLKAIDEIRVVCITQTDKRIDHFLQLITSYGAKVHVEYVRNPYISDGEMLKNIESEKTITENYTFQKIWNDSQKEDMEVGYFHTKGITAIQHLHGGQVGKFKNYYQWRQFLNWGVLTNWEACTKALDYADVSGVNYQTDPSPHFSGNFWWSTSGFIRLLPDPATKDWWYALKEQTTNPWLKTCSDRFRDEQWVCSTPGTNAYNIFNLPASENPAGVYLPASRYTEYQKCT